MLELRNIQFDVEDNKEILKDVNLKIEERFVAVTGPNGGGKSTLAKIIAGIVKPTAGKILLDGEDITEIAQADVHFHDVIYKASDNGRLTQLLSNLGEQMYRYRVEYLKNTAVYDQLMREHQEIICHIKNRRKDEAVKVICEHIDNQVAAIRDTIRTKRG